MLFEEALQGLHLQTVEDVGLPLEGGSEEQTVAVARAGHELLVLHVAMGQTGQLAALPAVMRLEPAHVQASEEEHAVEDQRELVNVSQLHGVLGLDHLETKAES